MFQKYRFSHITSLYKNGSSAKCVGLKLRRWLGWAILGLAMLPVYAGTPTKEETVHWLNRYLEENLLSAYYVRVQGCDVHDVFDYKDGRARGKINIKNAKLSLFNFKDGSGSSISLLCDTDIVEQFCIKQVYNSGKTSNSHELYFTTMPQYADKAMKALKHLKKMCGGKVYDKNLF